MKTNQTTQEKQEHKCHWRAYGQPDGTVVCDECNTAADVNKLIVQITPQGKRKGLVMVKKLEKLQLEADPGSIDYSDERYMTVQNLFKIENKTNQLIDLVYSQQEAIEKLKGANQVEIDYVRKHFGKFDDRIEKLEKVITRETVRIATDDIIDALSGSEEPIEMVSKARYAEKLGIHDTHRTVTLRIPNGMRIGKALFEAWDNDGDDVWSDLDEWLRGISDTDLQKALDEVEYD